MLERDVDVVISGMQTSFDAATTVDFGPGITVAATTLVSAAELRSRVHIDAGAAVGPRDIEVTSGGTMLIAHQAFEVRPSLAVEFVGGPASGGDGVLQGDLLLLDVASLDDQPLASSASSRVAVDDGLILLPNGADWNATISQFVTIVDIAAPLGGKRITWTNPAFNGRTFVSDGAVLAVGARTAVDVPAPFTPTTVVFDSRSKLYAITTSQLGILSLTGSGGAMALHPLTGLWAPPVGIVSVGVLASGLAFATRNTTMTFDVTVGGVSSVGTDASHTLTLDTVLTPVAAMTAEAGSAHPYAAPQPLTAPAIVDGAFTVAGEDDSYSVAVPGGSSVELTVLAPQELQYAVGTAGNTATLSSLTTGGLTFRTSNPLTTPISYVLKLVATTAPGQYTVTARVY
jgi:hypothetical protein